MKYFINKKFYFLLIFLILILFLGLTIQFLRKKYNLVEEKSHDNVEINKNIIQVEIADEKEEQLNGLSNRENLNIDNGMLFIFNNKQKRSFWMKNMNFPIDIIWIDDNKIIKIDKNISPEGENPEYKYSSNSPVDKVLEVNSGYCDKHNISEGDLINYNIKND